MDKLNNLRKKEIYLSQSDWIVIKEREEGGSVSNFADWKKYRQELRDITKTYKSLEDVKSYCTFGVNRWHLSKIQNLHQLVVEILSSTIMEICSF